MKMMKMICQRPMHYIWYVPADPTCSEHEHHLIMWNLSHKNF